MKIAKIVAFSYEIVYVDDDGKYSAHKRSSNGEWSDAITGRKIGDRESLDLESVYKKEKKTDDQ